MYVDFYRDLNEVVFEVIACWNNQHATVVLFLKTNSLIGSKICFFGYCCADATLLSVLLVGFYPRKTPGSMLQWNFHRTIFVLAWFGLHWFAGTQPTPTALWWGLSMDMASTNDDGRGARKRRNSSRDSPRPPDSRAGEGGKPQPLSVLPSQLQSSVRF